MFEQIKVYKEMITAILIVIVSIVGYVYISSLKSQIVALNGDLKDSQVELANSKLVVERYRNVTTKQNEEIKAHKLNEKLNNAKLAKWQHMPDRVKYKTIREIVKVESNECKDIKNTLGSIKSLDFSVL